MERTPIRNMGLEKPSEGAGPVTTYTLPPEELEKLRQSGGKPDGKPDGKPQKKAPKPPMDFTDRIKRGLTKEVVEEELNKGKTVVQIEKELGLKKNTLAYHIKKWGLKGKTPPATKGKSTSKKTVAPVKTETPPQKLEAAVTPAETPVPADPVINDPVNHPAHYTAGSVECIEAIEAATVGLLAGEAYNTGAAIKYLWRWKRKNGIEDLRKARWYIDRLIEGTQ
ncbi:hypothetical protein J31TS4_16060 [Paenibacillus sp. J31TS4]|uniref:DUF3310 domain-containing protein n=1 Tax=Paenibacillus sp. J31TS4 TaxID=2807195 RepID=UPI001B15F2C6|nr:DUF3310 domain-containing protein [Paenibacillus sp. J31TS4]GIP38326.1 hypothetical protein J31TS4_16060 [Paenibacillus sp. J31TS4]